MPRSHHDYALIINIGISILGLFIVLAFALNPSIVHENFLWRKPLVGLIFSVICILGILAALFPNECSKGLYSQRKNMNLTTLTTHQIHSTSHHPNCKAFSAHVIHINSHVLCAACTGLLLGALIALFGTFFYFFGGWHIEEVSLPLVLVGVAGILLGFFQLKFRSFIRMMLNVVFVLGAFVIVVGIDEFESLFVDLFLVALIAFWILTRIQLSRWDHWRICSNCESPCEVQEVKKEKSLVSATHSVIGSDNYQYSDN